MPDDSGKLTEAERKEIAAKLTELGKGQSPLCPICGSPEWVIAEHLVMPITLGKGASVQLGGVGYPQVMVISSKCGHTRYVNALALGIQVQPPNEEAKKE